MKTCVEYIWIDKTQQYRSKTKVFQNKIKSLEQLPNWNFDGSSTNQNKESNNTEVVLVPIRLFNDPMRGYHHKLVLCECYHNYNEATHCNERYKARQIFKQKKQLEPWFGMEQEYFILNPDTKLPIGYSPTKKQGQFYCGNGSENSYGRKFAEEHLKLCMDAGVNICGINAEVSPGQWEFQVGPCEGIEIGDHMHIARYLLYKATEIFNCYITLEPKPLKGNYWNGSGCHTNFSTNQMRNGTDKHDGYYYIKKAVERLGENHHYHMMHYGENNEERMTGNCETADYDNFTWSVGGRDVSVRIGNETYENKKGYFEDRRPGSNCDPYLVSSLIFKSCCLFLK